MGAVCSELIERVVNEEAFNRKQSGPTLRRLFGAYRNPDFWAVYRRFRAIDDGNGYVSYEELQQCVSLAEYQMLFIWETFSQQNELIEARELMTVICVFSSAPLLEKGKFLQALFDDSSTGLNTASEIVTLFHMVLSVLTKCTGIPVKVKEVRDQLKSVMPDLLPSWVEALERSNGKSEVAFNTDRFIGQIEMEQLVPSITDVYETLPIAGPPPPGATQPPPPDWATPATLEKGANKAPDAKPKAATGQSAKALSKAELAHLEWMSKLDDEESGEGKENWQRNNMGASQQSSKGREDDAAEDAARCWMVIYGTDFSVVGKNLASFRHLFMRSVSGALGLPMGSIEVVNIQRAGKDSILIEFLLNPSSRDSAYRDGETLKQALEQQLSLPHSALRKGQFKDYVATAELVERPGRKSKKADNVGESSQLRDSQEAATPGRRRDQACQTADAHMSEDVQVADVLKDLEASEAEARLWQERAEKAIAERDAALKELAALKGQ